ncbi:diol dehydratase small subunit [Clostridium fallax]|uniref:Propanediol dehydratase small subunit n=1 Tax=Clostridium fallax TaxID=1533 RepID=A0A1M4XBY3_9CLOT|nr:diol dehydratase small subunit [Clostridium fallax]SHE91044.1 propanediol dehydratase small subunit [Clostridium fallax]SQB05985.1 coenzyme B12-dependent glycerol dehydratase, small subunit [Clostridium fallax]
MKYPLSKNNLSLKSKSGKRLDDITIEGVINGEITGEDIKISKETLIMQSNIARENKRDQLGDNLERASELVEVPDDELLNIYNMLRPNRSTETELLKKAEEIEKRYKAVNCSKLIREAVEVYKRRGILK